MITALHIALGILAGIASARLHLAMVHRAARQTTRAGRGGAALATMPVRLAVGIVPLAALAKLGGAALVAGLGASIVTRVLRTRADASVPPEESR